jgi:Flp pilus assembly pilin Flp
LKAFFQAEEGQASAEYILILTIMVGIVVTVIHRWFKPMMDRVGDQLKSNLEENFFKEDAFHRLNL